jgi:hypothetical protein
LLSYLSRYGITETDIAANSFPQLSTSGAFPAFRIARFITGVDALRLRFDPRTQLDRDVRALASLARRLPSRPSSLTFSRAQHRVERGRCASGTWRGSYSR